MKRDLNADLAICEAAHPAFIFHTGVFAGQTGGIYAVTEVCRDDYEPLTESDCAFLAEAREGWPEAIRRAQAVEAELAEWKNRAQEAEDLAEHFRDENERLRETLVKHGIVVRKHGAPYKYLEVSVNE
jgi:hypothetical protein